MRQRGGSDDRRVRDLHLVVHFVALLEAAQDRDRVLNRGLVHQYLLEATLQCRVFLDVLTVLVEGGRADAVELAARKRGLKHVAGVHRAVSLTGADHRVQLVDEQDDLALLFGEFIQDTFQPLLEVAAVLGAGDQRAHVERKNSLPAQPFRNLAVDYPQREALDDGGLAHARFADKHRIVLGAPLEHLDGAADLVVATDNRIQLAGFRAGREIDRVFIESATRLLGIRVDDFLARAHLLDGFIDAGPVRAALRQRLGEIRSSLERRQQEQLR